MSPVKFVTRKAWRAAADGAGETCDSQGLEGLVGCGWWLWRDSDLAMPGGRRLISPEGLETREVWKAAADGSGETRDSRVLEGFGSVRFFVFLNDCSWRRTVVKEKWLTGNLKQKRNKLFPLQVRLNLSFYSSICVSTWLLNNLKFKTLTRSDHLSW